jgi:hypothetical protein
LFIIHIGKEDGIKVEDSPRLFVKSDRCRLKSEDVIEVDPIRLTFA